jgi:hypothetical protein
MILELDLHLLYKSGLSPNQFIFCDLLREGHYLILQKLIKTTGFVNKESITDLLSKKYVISNEYFNLNDFNSTIRFLSITDKFKSILPVKNNDPFQDILNLYPTKTLRPDGNTDYLKTGIKKCNTKYNNIIKRNPSKHELIVEALKYELNIRKKENTLKFMKRLPKWISDEEWEVFIQRMEDDNGNNKVNNNYGGNLL